MALQYTLFDITADKTAFYMHVTGLIPGTTYYFVVQTRTLPCAFNENTVDSEYSNEVSAATYSTITVTAPNGGESLCVGEEYYITWASTGINNVFIEYTTNNGEQWNPIDTVPALGGRFTWTVPNTPSDSCLIRINGADSPGDPSDVSDSVFSIISN